MCAIGFQVRLAWERQGKPYFPYLALELGSLMPAQARLETDEHEVFAANQAFYQAMESLDLPKMEAMWWHEDWVNCLHPGWDLISGWEDVLESWTNIFRSTLQMRITVTRVLIHVLGDAAW